jgi:LPPG:FO 2-phospho-L-lactate transferase
VEPSAYAVAAIYKDLVDTFILDQADIHERQRIERLGLKVVAAETLMKSLDDKVQLAAIALKEVQHK